MTTLRSKFYKYIKHAADMDGAIFIEADGVMSLNNVEISKPVVIWLGGPSHNPYVDLSGSSMPAVMAVGWRGKGINPAYYGLYSDIYLRHTRHFIDQQVDFCKHSPPPFSGGITLDVKGVGGSIADALTNRAKESLEPQPKTTSELCQEILDIGAFYKTFIEFRPKSSSPHEGSDNTVSDFEEWEDQAREALKREAHEEDG